MAIFLMITVILGFLYLSFHLYINHIIDSYLQNQTKKHLKPVGIDEQAFIGLHKKALDLENAYMIYARKTTAYKGVILFNPDYQLTYRFYMPLINFLCRQGYILVTKQNEYLFYTQTQKDFDDLYNYVINDEVLGTYPLSCLGHGTGALIQLQSHHEKILCKIGFQPKALELNEILNLIPKKQDYITQAIIKSIQKQYHFNIDISPTLDVPTYLIYGDQDEFDGYTLSGANIKVLNGQGHYPFLNMNSEQRIKSLECLLAYPSTSQFDYNKALETFDTSTLYDLNQEVLDILPYLFDTENTK